MSPTETVPGTAVLDVVNGHLKVLHAPDVIALNVEGANQLMAAFGLAPLAEPDEGLVVLDPDGEYVYRLIELDRWDRRIGTYERVRKA